MSFKNIYRQSPVVDAEGNGWIVDVVELDEAQQAIDAERAKVAALESELHKWQCIAESGCLDMNADGDVVGMCPVAAERDFAVRKVAALVEALEKARIYMLDDAEERDVAVPGELVAEMDEALRKAKEE